MTNAACAGGAIARTESTANTADTSALDRVTRGVRVERETTIVTPLSADGDGRDAAVRFPAHYPAPAGGTRETPLGIADCAENVRHQAREQDFSTCRLDWTRARRRRSD